ncbi:MAG TPA: hypothetical protein VFQ30_09930 [Ktedonobacteraceae bacterium]|nr:hypothetical protein [Ktedonobacteraceae bacterium]
MERPYRHQQSHLFTIRLWQEELGEGRSEWRGKVQHVQSGEVWYFRQWSALVGSLEKMLAEFETRSRPGQSDIDDVTH